MTGTDCQRKRCPGTYEEAGYGRNADALPVAFFECDRCGDLQTERRPEPPTIPLFDAEEATA